MITGQLGDEDQQNATAKVVRVIVAGNSLSQDTQDKEQLSKAKYLTKKTAATSVEAIKSADDLLVQLAGSVEVDLMPGKYDPVNFVLPQQPLHRCMFPQANMYPTLNSVTNPYECSVDDVRILGTSGQPIDNIYMFSDLEDRLDILEKTLQWGHLAPTAPDTLGCYPYHDDDPFLLQECPHIYFSANQPKFQTKMFEGPLGQQVRLISIPRFSQTNTCVLVNLRTLECQPITFKATFSPPEQESSPEVDK
jgi:DNA polymerase delta subunit 2